LHGKYKIKIFLKIHQNEFSIKIEDDGNGFSKDVLDKLGEPYISKSKKGMGLGIFIAKNLIENMKGNIIFYNSVNNSAVVEIKFDKTILV
jgi:two-component system sensor histidine kinase RegB